MKQTKTMRAGKSDYTYIVERGFIAITDLNRGGRSVTNDAENVIQDLVAAGIDVNTTQFCTATVQVAGTRCTPRKTASFRDSSP